MVVGPGDNRFGNARPQFEVRLRRHRNLPAAVTRFVQDVGNAQNPGRGLDEAEVNAAELYPVAVGAAVNTIEGPAAGRVGLEGPRLQVGRRHLRLIEQAPRHQGRFDGPSPARLLPAQERRRHADGGEQRRPYAGQRMHHVHRPRAVSRHGFQDAHAGHDQLVDGRLVLERTAFAVGRDGAVNQSRIKGGEPVGAHQRLPLGGRRKVLKDDIGAAQQALVPRRLGIGGGLRQVQAPACLAAVPHPVAAGPQGLFAAVEQPGDPGAVVAKKHARHGPCRSLAQFQHRDAIQRARHRMSCPLSPSARPCD